MVASERSAKRLEDVRIAAIIPLYNGASYIEQALNSVLQQSLPPAEIIVVDDGSTDNGPYIVEEIAKRHRISLLRKPNGGQSAARNFGIAHASADFIALLDQDDVWYVNHLERLVKPFLRRRGVKLGWVYSNLDEIDVQGRMVNRSMLRLLPIQHPKQHLLGCLKTDMFILPSASLLSREAFDAVGGFDERLLGYEDDDLFLRMFRAGYDNVYLDQPLSQWRIYPASSSFSPRMAVSRMIYLRKLLADYPDEPDQGIYWRRDVLIPRFLPMILKDLRRASKVRDRRLIWATFENLKFASRYHRWTVRVGVHLLAPLLRCPRVTVALLTPRPALRWVGRLVLR